ncbi:LysR family transcriptional regulator [Yokenella regensburgei]|uniref:LysR family transcriptional regulator n=1 Tax=Yokenella regensburgei TaxID=158877 RepID=UPI0027D9615C|nr:LysR substrate-binding domain-containing protein [Yokenella regensburgei]MDQ4430712.1 LysR family transcriptional regulator [Yokenella regensburgei]
MRISLEQLTAFSAIASEHSFSSAARKLGKSQSALSIAIANLEIDLGLTLFNRSNRYPQLTTEGKALLRDAEAILEQCFSMENRANSLSKELETEVTISIDDAIPYQAISPVLQDFSRQFPHTDLIVLHPSSQDALSMIENESVQLGIMCTRAHYSMNLRFKRLGNISFCNVASRDHPLNKGKPVTFSQLNQYRQLVYLPFLNKLPTSEYLNSPNHWRVESYLTLMHMLRDGMGWATVPKQLMQELNLHQQLVELQLDAYPFTEWVVGVDLVWSAPLRSGQALAWLRERLGQKSIASLVTA